MIRLSDYPQLKLLVWNSDVSELEDELAFSIYERNWRWIEVEALTAGEALLIERLKNSFGGGVLHV